MDNLGPIARALHRALAPPDRRPIWQWAAEHVFMPAVLTVTGRFNPDVSPYLIPIFDALQNDAVRRVTLMKPVRGAGSVVGDVWFTWIPANDPGSIMGLFQEEPLSKQFSTSRIQPMLRACAPTAALLSENRHDTCLQEIRFKNGFPLYLSGPSITGLQGKGIRYLRIEELWTWPAGSYTEALGRIGDYEEIGMSKVFIISQGGLEDDDLDTAFREGDRRELFVPCLACGKFFACEIYDYREDGSIWGLRWNEDDRTRDKDGAWITAACLESLRYECPHCSHAHPIAEEARVKSHWKRSYEYRPQNPNALPSRVSFHYTAAITRNWTSLAEELIAALNALRIGIVDPLRSFVQKRSARSWSENYLTRGRKVERFELQSEYPDERGRFLSVDRQAEGVHWGLVASINQQGFLRRLWFGKLYSEDEIKAKQLEYKVPAPLVLIDSGHDAKIVYAMCARNGWIALKGDDRKHWIHLLRVRGADSRIRETPVQRSYSKPVKADPEIGKARQGQRYAILIHWSNPTIKDRLDLMIRKSRILEPKADPKDPMEIEYAQQMRGQWRKKVTNKTTMRSQWIWVDNGNDHVRDLWCQALLAATIRKWLPDIEAEPKEDSAATTASS